MRLMRSTWSARLAAALLLVSLLPVLWPDLSAATAAWAASEDARGEHGDEAARGEATQSLGSVPAVPAGAHRLLQVVAPSATPASSGLSAALAGHVPALVRHRAAAQAMAPAPSSLFVRAWRLVTSAELMGP